MLSCSPIELPPTKDPHDDPHSCRETQSFRRRWPAAVACKVQCPQPDPVDGLRQPHTAGVHTAPRGAVGVPQLRVVEDVATSTGAATTMRATNAYPVGAAARHPRQLHGRCSGQFDGTPGGDVHREPVQCCGGQAHAQRAEAVPEHALDLRGGSSLLVARQRAEHGPGVAAALLLYLAGRDRPGRPASRA
jgi:hypothetical protein